MLPGPNFQSVLPSIFHQPDFTICLSKLIPSKSPSISKWLIYAQAPARQLGTVARACVADGLQNAGMTAASRVQPQNSERDAHRLFDRFWLSLRVPISYIQVEAQEDGMHSSIPCYKVFFGWGALCTTLLMEQIPHHLGSI